MELEKAKKASELLNKINTISEYKKIISDSQYGSCYNFRLYQHYGKDSDNIVFDKSYTPRFLRVVEDILKELEDELSAL